MKVLHIVPMVVLAAHLLMVACGDESPPTSTDPTLALGERLFKRECATCHSIESGATITGPSLSGIATRAATRQEGMDAREYILFSITKPSEYIVEGYADQMPSGFGKLLSEEELEGLISYLFTLK